MMLAIEKLAEKRRKWVEANRENGFEVGLKRLLTDLYPDNAHFVYELLQNAEDADAQTVRFILQEDCIEFEHDGKKLFTIKDVDAITSIGFSTKLDDATNIGKFGVGFKAVFGYTETPRIESGEFYFRIRDMVVPESDGLIGRKFGDKQTRFILPFDNPKKTPAQARSEIERLLKALGATTLLFLTYIRKIEYLLPDLALGYIERINLGDNRFEIRVQHPHELAPSSAWFLKFDKEVWVEDEETDNQCQKVKSCRIAVAFGLSPVEAKAGAKEKKAGSVYVSPEWELSQMEPGHVCIYFPADKETSNLGFHLHAPFASTVARDSVRDCAGNIKLRDHLADLLAESMSAIRDQGLLTLRALAVLPNDKDNLPRFYQPFIARLVREFQEQDLVPMKRGGHCTADRIFRGSKALSDLIDDDDMVTLLGDDYFPPMWAANPSLRYQSEDNFLSMLDIAQWDTAELVKALGRLNKDALGHWMGCKDEKWHQNLYEMLIDFINAAPKHPYTEASERKGTIKGLELVRCIDALHRKGSECFFPTDGIEPDGKFPCVAKGVYFLNKEENKKAREFLVTVGVREVDEKAEIEYILKERYSQEAVDKKQFRPELNDIDRFIVFAEKYPGDNRLFQDHDIFNLEDGKWGKPNQVYLDLPFLETNLNIFYQLLRNQSEQWALSEKYKTCRANLKQIGEFAKKLGAITVLNVNFVSTYYSKDYTIEHIEDILASKNINASKLIWQTCISRVSAYPSFLYKLTRPDGRYNFSANGDSSIIAALKKYAWVPQQSGELVEFVRPHDAVAEKLPKGFTFQTDWQWLKALDFGLAVKERIETQRREKESQSQEYKHKEKIARDMGFDSPEAAEEMARLAKENPEAFRKFKEEISSSKGCPTFPTRSVSNPEQRQERLGEQLSHAPDKEYEKRERSVRTTKGAIDPSTWLRNEYTNEASQMVCQICKEEMPFRKRNGEYYFETVEISDQLDFENEEFFLATCPVCAAKYKEYVKRKDGAQHKVMEEILKTDSQIIPIVLDSGASFLHFTEKHIRDLRTILSARHLKINDDQPLKDKEEKVIKTIHDTKEMVQCPNCQSKVRRDRLESHLYNVHGPGKKQKIQKKTKIATVPKSTNRRGCPGCGAIHGCYCK